MSIFRIYLLTYRRNNLLPRALESLLNQTLTDWICEVHNDDPTDQFPQQLVEKIADPRIILANHQTNLGPTRAFNLVFRETSEPFISLLEDDNWWEPHFLKTMIDAMNQLPDTQLAWSNMRLWQEEADGSWTDTGQNIWSHFKSNQPHLFSWGQPQQMMGALHSNGAMIVRAKIAKHLVIPDETPFDAMEAIRERAFPFPILFVPEVCANFALTRTTSRHNNHISWLQMQTLLTASFLKHSTFSQDYYEHLWLNAYSKPAKSTATLFFSAFICWDCRSILYYARWKDWIFFITFLVKHPIIGFKVLQSRNTFSDLWFFLDQRTEMRFKELKY